MGGTHRYWTHSGVPLLFAGHQTVVVDLLGLGDSPQPWFLRYTVDRHLEALRRSLPLDQPMILVGHSLGAILALAFASRYPHCVRELCLISLPYFRDQRAAADWFRARRGGWIYTNLLATALACIITRRVARRWLPRLLKDIPRVVAEDLVKHNVVSSTSSLWEVLYRHDLAQTIARLPAGLPVHCIHGQADDTAPLAPIQVLAQTQAQWRLTVLDGVDHHPWLRREAICRQLIADDLTRISGAG